MGNMALLQARLLRFQGEGNNDEAYLLAGLISSDHSVGGNNTVCRGSLIHYLLLGKERKRD